MKIHRGYLFEYFATGESRHIYVWTGKKSDEFHDWENHITVDEGDSFEIIEPKTKNSYVVHFWTYDSAFLKKLKRFEKINEAIEKNWKINLVKWSANEK